MWQVGGDDDHDNSVNDGINMNGGGNNNKNEDPFSSLLSTAAKAIPFLFEDGVGGITTNGSGQSGAVADNNGHDSDKMDLAVDMDMDSPSSPLSSDMSDIFEPPLNTPITSKKINKKRPRKGDSGRANKSKGKSYFDYSTLKKTLFDTYKWMLTLSKANLDLTIEK